MESHNYIQIVTNDHIAMHIIKLKRVLFLISLVVKPFQATLGVNTYKQTCAH